MSPHALRTYLFLVGGLGALVYALVPPGNPVWIGIAGTLLGAEPLARARPSKDEEKRE